MNAKQGGITVAHNVPLANYCSFGSGGIAENLIIIERYEQIQEIYVSKLPRPFWFLGEGCNVLISDYGLPGTVIVLRHSEIMLHDDCSITVDSGLAWDQFVNFSIDNGLWGAELMCGIPGTVGAGIVGNIGAYGQHISDIVYGVEVLDTNSYQTYQMSSNDMGYEEYRKSNLQQAANKRLCVTKATLKLSRAPTTELMYASALNVAEELGIAPDTLKHRRAIIMEARRRAGSLLCASSKNVGSFFLNPLVTPKQAEYVESFDETGKTKEQIKIMNKVHAGSVRRVSAAHVLLACGYQRGQEFGRVRLHPDHVLKIENHHDATSAEIYAVYREIADKVYETLGITLIPEVKMLGAF